MARRRMFSLEIVDTDAFLDMPSSAQSLYFHLGMRADDEGFVSSPRKITSIAGCSPDDLKILASKGFVIPFDSGVCVITDWKRNNYLQKDRFTPTYYFSEKAQLVVDDNGTYTISGDLSNMYTECIQDVYSGKDSIDKDSIETPLTPLYDSQRFTDAVNEAISDWLSYKKEKRQSYKPTGLKSLLTQIENKLQELTEQQVIFAITESMACNYQGIIWDKAKVIPSRPTGDPYIGMAEKYENLIEGIDSS